MSQVVVIGPSYKACRICQSIVPKLGHNLRIVNRALVIMSLWWLMDATFCLLSGDYVGKHHATCLLGTCS